MGALATAQLLFVRRTSVRFSLLRDAAGQPQYVASLQEDITERRRTEDALRESEAYNSCSSRSAVP